MAKPACMNIIRKHVTSVHTIFTAIREGPTASASSPTVGLPGFAAGTSAAVPVLGPDASWNGYEAGGAAIMNIINNPDMIASRLE
jgi:hypothetical protein